MKNLDATALARRTGTSAVGAAVREKYDFLRLSNEVATNNKIFGLADPMMYDMGLRVDIAV